MRVESRAVVVPAKASRLRLSARAARSSPPRRDGAYWHSLATSRHRLHCGRVASHFKWRERHGRQAREDRVFPRACDVAVLVAFMGVVSKFESSIGQGHVEIHPWFAMWERAGVRRIGYSGIRCGLRRYLMYRSHSPYPRQELIVLARNSAQHP